MIYLSLILDHSRINKLPQAPAKAEVTPSSDNVGFTLSSQFHFLGSHKHNRTGKVLIGVA